MADTDQPDLDLNTIIPLLQKQQNVDRSTAASNEALGVAGRTMAPHLYDLLTNWQKPPPGALPPPGTVGKVPQQDAMDPRMVPALSEMGMLGLGGVGGKMLGGAPRAAEMGESILGSAGRNAARFGANVDQSGLGRSLMGAGMQAPDMTSPADAAPRLTHEQRQQIEADRQRLENEGRAKAAETEAANRAALERSASEAEQQRKNKEAEAQLQLQLQEQQRLVAEAQAKRERETPFREAHPSLAKALPVAGIAGAAGLPYAVGALQKLPLNRFVNRWEEAGDAAKTALAGRAKGPAKAANEVLKDYENKWPGMEQRFTPGFGAKAAASILPAEGVAFPTEYDFATQGKDSPGRPTTEDLKDTALRAGLAGVAGTGLSKLGSAFVPKTAPYVGGQGLINAYNAKYPPTKTELKAQGAPPLPQNKGFLSRLLSGPDPAVVAQALKKQKPKQLRGPSQ